MTEQADRATNAPPSGPCRQQSRQSRQPPDQVRGRLCNASPIRPAATPRHVSAAIRARPTPRTGCSIPAGAAARASVAQARLGDRLGIQRRYPRALLCAGAATRGAQKAVAGISQGGAGRVPPRPGDNRRTDRPEVTPVAADERYGCAMVEVGRPDTFPSGQSAAAGDDGHSGRLEGPSRGHDLVPGVSND